MPKQRFFNLPSSKREKIIDATYDMFIEMDYEDVTIRALAEAFDISVGSFYQYFHDKDDLYLYLMSSIEKKIYAAHKQKSGYFLMDSNIIPIEEICTQKEIEFNRTWYRAPVEVMVKFYFGEYSRDLNSNVMDELIKLQKEGKLRDSVDIDFIFYIYATSMFNILMYFRENNITDNEEKIDLKTKFYTDWFLKGILK